MVRHIMFCKYGDPSESSSQFLGSFWDVTKTDVVTSVLAKAVTHHHLVLQLQWRSQKCFTFFWKLWAPKRIEKVWRGRFSLAEGIEWRTLTLTTSMAETWLWWRRSDDATTSGRWNVNPAQVPPKTQSFTHFDHLDYQEQLQVLGHRTALLRSDPWESMIQAGYIRPHIIVPIARSLFNVSHHYNIAIHVYYPSRSPSHLDIMISTLPTSPHLSLFGSGPTRRVTKLPLDHCNRQIKPLTFEEAKALVRQQPLLDEEKLIALNYRLRLAACMKDPRC